MNNVVHLAEKMNLTVSTSQNSLTKEQVEYSCPKCQDRGIYLVDSNMARVCECQKAKRLDRLFESSKITPAFRTKTFENFELAGRPEVIHKLFQSAKAYTEQFESIKVQENNWLVLLGEPGCGKTHLSMAVANQLLKDYIPVLYFQHVEGMNELKDAIKDRDTSVEDKLNEMKKAPVLIWDDLFKGREIPTGWVIETVFEVLNYRYLNLLPTIISSERTPKQLLEVDKAIGSRIVERGKGYMVVVEGLQANFRLR